MSKPSPLTSASDFFLRHLVFILVITNALVLTCVAFIAVYLLVVDLQGSDIITGNIEKIIGYVPYGILVVGVFLTSVLAVQSYIRKRQARNMAAMATTLQGRTAALQHETAEREKLFQALRRNEREFRAVVNSVSDVIFETDKDGVLKFLNQSWEKLTGITPADGLEKSIFDMLWPQDQKHERAQFDALVGGQRHAYRSETKIMTISGSYRTIELSVSMLRLTEDQSVRVVGTITDIEKRRQAEKALRDAEQKYRSIVENAVRGMCQTTPEGRFLSANRALAEILGYDTPEVLVQSVSDIGTEIYVDPAYRETFLQRVMEEDVIVNAETQVYRKDGSKIWIAEDARAVRDADGNIIYFEGGLEDTTKRREAAEALKEAKLQAEITARAKSDFLGNMGHELRTPLNAIIGFSEILKNEVMGKLGSDAYKEYAEEIHQSGTQLLQVINEILEVSKIETGKRSLKEEIFHVSEAIAPCIEILAPRIAEAGLVSEIEIAEDMPKILAEKLAMKQILLNLLSNAVKFTPAGGNIKTRVSLTSDKSVKIEVIDSGSGIPEEEIPRALSPFGQVNTELDRNLSGTGLGLTIVQLLVNLHGGRFELFSKPGAGTTACVVLPTRCVATQDPQ